MTQYRKFEANGRHGVAISHDSCEDSDDLGRGGGESIAMFLMEESREYFIQTEKMRERVVSEVRKYECLVNALRYAVKRRNVRKRILELIK